MLYLRMLLKSYEWELSMLLDYEMIFSVKTGTSHLIRVQMISNFNSIYGNISKFTV